MTKKILFVLLCVCITLVFWGCENNSNENPPNTEAVDTLPVPLTLDDGIVLPPWVEPGERTGARWHYLYGGNDIVSAVRLSDGIVRCKVGNFIEEYRYDEGMGQTTFEVEITECIKGSLSGKIKVIWDAYSEGANAYVDLPFYGDEVLLFLRKDETDDKYFVYCDIEYDVISLDGAEYCVSRYNGHVIYQLSQLLPDYHLDEYPSLVDDVLEKLNERTSCWKEKTGRSYFMVGENSIGEIYLLSDFISLIEYIMNK